MINLVVQDVEKLHLREWTPMREPTYRREIILAVTHGGAVPAADDAETLNLLKTPSIESRLVWLVAWSEFLEPPSPVYCRAQVLARKLNLCIWQTKGAELFRGRRLLRPHHAICHCTSMASWRTGTWSVMLQLSCSRRDYLSAY